MIDQKLQTILQGLLDSEDDTGCSFDPDDEDSFQPTVVNRRKIVELKEYLKNSQQRLYAKIKLGVKT